MSECCRECNLYIVDTSDIYATGCLLYYERTRINVEKVKDGLIGNCTEFIRKD